MAVKLTCNLQHPLNHGIRTVVVGEFASQADAERVIRNIVRRGWLYVETRRTVRHYMLKHAVHNFTTEVV